MDVETRGAPGRTCQRTNLPQTSALSPGRTSPRVQSPSEARLNGGRSGPAEHPGGRSRWPSVWPPPRTDAESLRVGCWERARTVGSRLGPFHCGPVPLRVVLRDDRSTARRCTFSRCSLRGATVGSAACGGLTVTAGEDALSVCPSTASACLASSRSTSSMVLSTREPPGGRRRFASTQRFEPAAADPSSSSPPRWRSGGGTGAEPPSPSERWWCSSPPRTKPSTQVRGERGHVPIIAHVRARLGPRPTRACGALERSHCRPLECQGSFGGHRVGRCCGPQARASAWSRTIGLVDMQGTVAHDGGPLAALNFARRWL